MILEINELCTQMDDVLAGFIHNIIIIIKIAVPIVLIVFGILDLSKGVVASKEDEVKKGQNTFIKRLIAGAVVFFIITIVQLITNIIDKETDGEIWKCANLLMNGKPTETSENNYKSAEILQKNPSAFKSCCEYMNGIMKGSKCYDSDQEEMSNTKMVECVEASTSKLNEKYPTTTWACCHNLGGEYTNNKCIDKNGGTVSIDNVNSCVVNQVREMDKEIFNICCNSLGGNPTNNKCIDNNGGNISDDSINSCILSKIR